MDGLLCVWILLGALTTTHAHVTFTNLKCEMADRTFGDVMCRIKAVNRTHKYMELRAQLFKLPVENITVNLKLMRYNHGYKVFFIDVNVDACKFLANPRNPIVRSFYNIFKKNSNANHTCPYNHDVIVDKLFTGNLEADFAKYVPMVNGDYAFFTEWSTNKIHRAFLKVYFSLSGSKVD
ncbi:uncharacterized protein [Drosophila pseudoobscura]|uniref:Uncharacterized protein n=1 Tax=Drosophila pseudoobscura pseudoobscura TaxID=46245 RepID=A0A0R3P935_DROPS|nr:uncharacterized protein LOC6899999 [Drosophila pseudoobscura]